MGPSKSPQPKKGVVVIGATKWVDNYNVPVKPTDINLVKKTSRKVSGRAGGLESVQAMGLAHDHELTEVAGNLLDPDKVRADQVQSEVERQMYAVGKGYCTDFSQEKIVEMYAKLIQRIASCISLRAITVSSKSLLKLTREDPCYEYYDILITNLNLKSFIYHGMHIFRDTYFYVKDSFNDISSLSDAFICAIDSSEPEHDFVKLIHDLRHVEVLAVCTYTLWCVTIRDDMEQLPISLQNLKELQLLAGKCIYGFFRQLPSPFIEKLFIQLSGYDGDQLHVCLKNKVEDPLDVYFDHLKEIRIINFAGCEGGMRIVSFLLQKAVNLESMVLIMHSKFTGRSKEIEQGNDSEPKNVSGRINDMKTLHDEVLSLSKASPRANIIVLEYEEGSTYWTPTHTEYF